MQALGVDLGFGAVKVAGALGRMSFASAWVPHTPGGEAWGIGAGEQPLLVDGRPVVVGDRAARRPGVRRPFADGRLADPETLPLLGAALWRAGVRGDVVLGSGTPLGRFAQERAAAQAALQGRLLSLADGSHETRVRIARLVLRPQGVGAALALAAQGRLPGGAGYVVVLDVGTRTTDVLTLEAGDLSPVMLLCFSLEAGVATAAEALAAAAQAETGHLPPADVAQAALRETQTWHGRPVGGPDEAGPCLDALAATIRAEVQRRFGAAAGRIAALAVVGGGGVLLRERLVGALPGECLAVADEEAVFSNAEGFWWAAERAGVALGVS